MLDIIHVYQLMHTPYKVIRPHPHLKIIIQNYHMGFPSGLICQVVSRMGWSYKAWTIVWYFFSGVHYCD